MALYTLATRHWQLCRLCSYASGTRLIWVSWIRTAYRSNALSYKLSLPLQRHFASCVAYRHFAVRDSVHCAPHRNRASGESGSAPAMNRAISRLHYIFNIRIEMQWQLAFSSLLVVARKRGEREWYFNSSPDVAAYDHVQFAGLYLAYCVLHINDCSYVHCVFCILMPAHCPTPVPSGVPSWACFVVSFAMSFVVRLRYSCIVHRRLCWKSIQLGGSSPDLGIHHWNPTFNEVPQYQFLCCTITSKTTCGGKRLIANILRLRDRHAPYVVIPNSFRSLSIGASHISYAVGICRSARILQQLCCIFISWIPWIPKLSSSGSASV